MKKLNIFKADYFEDKEMDKYGLIYDDMDFKISFQDFEDGLMMYLELNDQTRSCFFMEDTSIYAIHGAQIYSFYFQNFVELSNDYVIYITQDTDDKTIEVQVSRGAEFIRYRFAASYEV